MSGSHDNDRQTLVKDVVDDPVVADPDPPGRPLSRKLARAPRPRVVLQVSDRDEDAIPCRTGKLANLARRSTGEPDP